MRILQVVHGFPPTDLAGTELCTFHLSRALLARGHEVLVLYRAGSGDGEQYAASDGRVDGIAVVQIINRPGPRPMEETYRVPAVDIRFREVVARFQPDVVHFQHLVHLSASLLLICKELGIPSVLTLHDFWFQCPKVQLLRSNGALCPGYSNPLMCATCILHHPAPEWLNPLLRACAPAVSLGLKLYEHLRRLGKLRTRPRLRDALALVHRAGYLRQALSAADVRISPSRFVATKFAERGYGVPILVNDNGTNLEPFRGFQRQPSTRLRFGFLGTLRPHKGAHILIEGFNRLGPVEAELHIFGRRDGDSVVVNHCAHLDSLAAGNPRIYFRGEFQNECIADVMAQIDVLVVPSLWYENSPVVVHEAFAAHAPVVASNIGGLAELVKHGRNGLLFRVGDPVDLADKLGGLIREPALPGRLADGIAPVKSMSESAIEHERLYADLVERHSASGTSCRENRRA